MMGFFYKDTAMKEDRIKILETEVAYLWKAIEQLLTIVEKLKPEVHTHHHIELKNCNIGKETATDDPDSINPFNM